MQKGEILRRRWMLGMSLVFLGILTGCSGPDYYYGGEGPAWYGPDYDDYYGPGYYGDVWGPDVYVFGHHHHGGFDHDFGRRRQRTRPVHYRPSWLKPVWRDTNGAAAKVPGLSTAICSGF